ncbi:MAG: hypothetical protein MJA84_16665, partial [Firmicutes bacterium]|nr:hypothetical protein [Bacillota bacterium]
MKHLLKKRLLVWLMCIFVIALGVIYHPANAASAGNIYYVDIIGGDDHNDGLSQSKAFKTLGKVNSINYQPGDKILFKASGIWTGQLKFLGSGTGSNPIVIDMYGSGSKPVIDGAGLVGEGVVYIYNQEYIEVNNLEITNDAPDAADRRGVEVIGSNFGTVDHIVLRNLNIHNVKGIAGNSLDAKRTAAIYIATRSDDTVPTRFNNVLIEGCTIASVDNQGIITNNEIKHSDYPYTQAWNARRFSNLVIRNNVISDIGKNAIVTRLSDNTCLVEYNVCYDTAVRAGTGNTIFSRSSAGTVFQFNEGYRNLTVDYDGCLYNADLNSVDCIFQYSYSHDNNHGLFWSCTTSQDDGNIVRYNISQNDKGGIFVVNYPTQGLDIYNNTVYIGPNVSPKIIY